MVAATEGWFVSFQGEFLCFQAAMGAFLWRWRRERYHFSIAGGHARGLPVEASCPSLRVALHATEMKRAAFRSSSTHYAGEVRGVLAAGLCAAALASERSLAASDAARCRAAAYQAEDLLARPDDVASAHAGFRGRSWTAEETVHCGSRAMHRLLADHKALLAASGRRVSVALLRWALAGNATGRYSLGDSSASAQERQRLEILAS
eukprot:gnl/TRDRNA2_/TRDRNA2_137174_c1_seq2.p1 gnl/TRDRNA2_/TRDRNA2_137174_c1~~gnl/TRDRNA2_/TRDRNA2_137174_c1_seq2.p1  ORF type:complete len:241 (+),score=35.56 gnl/TRDRNA2_/TRDRNA2_137174_c1_seq2:106-723(+)